MAIFDNFGKKVGKVANDAAAKSRELAEIARYSVAISDERATMRMLYRDLGEKYYTEYRSPGLDDLKPFCMKIDTAVARINELEGKIRKIKGIRVCEACGEECDRKARFCAACGKPLPKEESADPAGPAENGASPETNQSNS
jgi:hypothetical protein